MAEEKVNIGDIIRKVKKLFKLAGGTSYKEEAASAMEKARQLLAEYNLSMDEVTVEDEGQKPTTEQAFGIAGAWQESLLRVICNWTNCSPFQSFGYERGGRGKTTLKFVGMPAEIEICKYTYEAVYSQIKKLRKTKSRKEREARRANGESSADSGSHYYLEGYTMGIIDHLRERLKKRVEEEETGRALVLVRNPKIDEWCNVNLGSRGRSFRSDCSAQGRVDGYQDGHKVRIHPGVEHNSSGRIR